LTRLIICLADPGVACRTFGRFDILIAHGRCGRAGEGEVPPLAVAVGR